METETLSRHFYLLFLTKCCQLQELQSKWRNWGSGWWESRSSPREWQVPGELGAMRKGNTFCLPLPWKYASGFAHLCLFPFFSQDLSLCFPLSMHYFINIRVIFSRHKMYLNNSCTSMIDIVPYGRRSRMHSSMSTCKDGLIYHNYHLQNWRSQIKA